jgi:hypothetical protein
VIYLCTVQPPSEFRSQEEAAAFDQKWQLYLTRSSGEDVGPTLGYNPSSGEDYPSVNAAAVDTMVTEALSGIQERAGGVQADEKSEAAEATSGTAALTDAEATSTEAIVSADAEAVDSFEFDLSVMDTSGPGATAALDGDVPEVLGDEDPSAVAVAAAAPAAVSVDATPDATTGTAESTANPSATEKAGASATTATASDESAKPALKVKPEVPTVLLCPHVSSGICIHAHYCTVAAVVIYLSLCLSIDRLVCFGSPFHRTLPRTLPSATKWSLFECCR